jgi:L-alanine-DL-glutamate epimerase-like enolase superfamily enzyme
LFSKNIKYTLLRVFTDVGLEGNYMVWSGVPAASPRAVADIIIHAFKPKLIGEDPLYREKIWQKLGGTVWGALGAGPALSAVDIALWDIAGKAGNLPIYKILGAYRDKIKAYASCMRLKNVQDSVEEAILLTNKGYSAIKLHGWGDLGHDLKVCRAVREALGDEISLMLDGCFAYDRREALKLGRELEKLNFHWYEAPLPHDNINGYVQLSKSLDIPLALEVLYNYAEYIQKGAIDIFRSVGGFTGGLSDMMKTAGLCYLSKINWEPHSWGSTLCQAANLHAMLAVKNCSFFELPIYSGQEGALDVAMQDVIRIDTEGYVHAPTKPGLGFDIDWDTVEALTTIIQ